MVITDILIHLSNISVLIGSSFKKIIIFRIFFVIGCSLEILYFSLISAKDLWGGILWDVAITSLNIFMIGLYLYEKGTVRLSDDEKFLFHAVFSQMDKANFRKLLNAGNWLNIEEGDILVFEKHTTDSLMLIFKGKVGIYINNEEVAVLQSGSFVGEMSFLTGGLATATCKALSEVKLYMWNKPDLIKLLTKNESLDKEMRRIFATDLVSKLTSTNTEDK